MKFFGITRFNLVTSKTLGAFRATKNKTLEAAKYELYNEAHLNTRLELLKCLCLPTYSMLSKQSSESYGLVLINEDFPQKIKSKLQELCNSIPRLSLVELNDNDDITDVIKPLIADLCDENDKIFTYRYDDDDALSIDFLEQIENGASKIDINTVISFSHGYCLSRIDNENYNMYVRNYPLNAFGLGIVSNLENFKTIFELGSHTKITEPVLLIEDTIGWLCTVHADNDSRVGKIRNERLNRKMIIEKISDKFPNIDTNILSNLTFRRDADNTFTVQTAHNTYLGFDVNSNSIIQVTSFGNQPNIHPIFIDNTNLYLFVIIDSIKMIFNSLNSEKITFSSDQNLNSSNEYQIHLNDRKFFIKINDKFLSARKTTEGIHFKLQNICDRWEIFTIV